MKHGNRGDVEIQVKRKTNPGTFNKKKNLIWGVMQVYLWNAIQALAVPKALQLLIKIQCESEEAEKAVHVNLVFLKKRKKVLADNKNWGAVTGGRNCAEVGLVAVVWMLEEEGCGHIRCVMAVGAGRETPQDSGVKSQRWHCPLPVANRRYPYYIS